MEREQLVDISSISIASMYNNQKLSVEWSQNNTIMILDAIESTTSSTVNVPIEDYNGMQFDASKIGLEYDFSGGSPNSGDGLGERKRRSAELSNVRGAHYNPYLMKVVQANQMDDEIAWDAATPYRNKRDLFNTNDPLLTNLPFNRTIYFDCQNAEQEQCLQAKFTVLNFKTGNAPILISLNFTIDLNKIGEFN